MFTNNTTYLHVSVVTWYYLHWKSCGRSTVDS